MNSQPTFLFLTYFNAMDYDHIYQKDVHEITLNRVKLSLTNIRDPFSNFVDTKSFLE